MIYFIMSQGNHCMKNFVLDDDECDQNSHGCGANSQCGNTVGSFTCACDTGYYSASGNNSDCQGKWRVIKLLKFGWAHPQCAESKSVVNSMKFGYRDVQTILLKLDWMRPLTADSKGVQNSIKVWPSWCSEGVLFKNSKIIEVLVSAESKSV